MFSCEGSVSVTAYRCFSHAENWRLFPPRRKWRKHVEVLCPSQALKVIYNSHSGALCKVYCLLHCPGFQLTQMLLNAACCLCAHFSSWPLSSDRCTGSSNSGNRAAREREKMCKREKGKRKTMLNALWERSYLWPDCACGGKSVSSFQLFSLSHTHTTQL